MGTVHIAVVSMVCVEWIRCRNVRLVSHVQECCSYEIVLRRGRTRLLQWLLVNSSILSFTITIMAAVIL